MKILFALAFLLCISVGYGLKCNQCLSLKSWEMCTNVTKEVTCQDGQDRCAKAHVEGESSGLTIGVYAKGCAKSSDCSKDNCKQFSQASVKITKCEINCCSGDLCNGAQVPMVSAIMLLACALVAFFR